MPKNHHQKRDAAAPSSHLDNMLQQAKNLHDVGLLGQARALYEKILLKQPKRCLVHCLLGTLAHQEGKLDESLKHWEKASSLDPHNPDILCNMSAIFLDGGRYQEAEKYASRAIKLSSQHHQAHYNLGAALLGQRKHKEAYPILVTAVKANPNNPDYCVSAGNAAVKSGAVKEGLDYFDQALVLAPQHETALYSQIMAKIMSLPMQARGDVCLAYLKLPQQQPLLRADILLKLAIHFWAVRDYAYVRKCLDIFAQTQVPNDPRFDKKYNIIKSFIFFLQKLLETNPAPLPNNLPNQKIFLIGDSHSLSYAGQVIRVDGQDHHVIPYYVDGAKAWHLGDGESAEHNYMLSAALSFLPEGARCWLSFGEIDCRLDDGIQMVKDKTKSLEAVARKTASSYVQRTSTLLRQHGITPAYLTVPAPNLDVLQKIFPALTEQERQNHTKTIAWFNDELCAAAALHKCSVVDLYGLTKNAAGIADGSLHLDGHHLCPHALGLASHYFPQAL